MWNDVPSMPFKKIHLYYSNAPLGGKTSPEILGLLPNGLEHEEVWGLSLTGQCDSTFHCWMIINICLIFFSRWMASRSISELQISPEMIRYIVTTAVPNLTLQLWVLSVFSALAAVLNVSHDTFFLCVSGLCNEAASRCAAAAPEEVWVGL